MPFCPECGKSVSPSAKFCRNCGASQLDDVVSPPEPAPRAQSAHVCPSCGAPLQPDEKFCGSCGARTGEPAAPSAPAVPPAPPAGEVCSSCGAPVGPGIKFCGVCGAPSQAPAPVPAPAAAPGPAPQGYVCAGCGSPLSGTEKFCGVCGQPAVGARPPAPAPAAAPAPAQPAGKFCGVCGAPVTATTKFCGGCGAPVGASFPAAPVAAPPVSPAAPPAAAPVGEEVLGVIPNAKRMKMLGAAWDTYTIVVTPRRMILAQLTQQMLNTALAEANAKARAEGKGFFGIMGEQLSASFGFGRRYESMSPDQALSETPGNFAIENQRITAVKLKLIETHNPGTEWHEFKLIVESLDGKFEYIIAEDDRFTTLLKTAYGDRVKMPFGLFSAGPVRVKFF